MAQKKAQALDQPAYSPNLTLRLFLFRILKSVPDGSRHDSCKSLVEAIYQCPKDMPTIKDYQNAFKIEIIA